MSAIAYATRHRDSRSTRRYGLLSVAILISFASTGLLRGMTDEQAISAFYFGSRDYNLITFGDYTLGSHGTWGGIAVGGAFTDTGKATIVEGGQYIKNAIHAIPGRSTASDPTAIFNGKINTGEQKGVCVEIGNTATGSPGTVALNSNVVPGYWNGSRYGIGATSSTNFDSYPQIQAGGMIDLKSTASIVNFPSLKNQLSTAQATLGSKASTIAYNTIGSIITATSTGATIDYLNFTTEQLTGKELVLSVKEGDLLVINLHVNSQSLSLNDFRIGADANATYYTNTAANRILWNIIFADNNKDDESLTLTVGQGDQMFWGSILSTTDTIESLKRVTGQVIANNFKNTETELHMALFETDVPEPSTIALIIGSLSLGFVFWQRRQRKM